MCAFYVVTPPATFGSKFTWVSQSACTIDELKTVCINWGQVLIERLNLSVIQLSCNAGGSLYTDPNITSNRIEAPFGKGMGNSSSKIENRDANKRQGKTDLVNTGTRARPTLSPNTSFQFWSQPRSNPRLSTPVPRNVGERKPSTCRNEGKKAVSYCVRKRAWGHWGQMHVTLYHPPIHSPVILPTDTICPEQKKHK